MCFGCVKENSLKLMFVWGKTDSFFFLFSFFFFFFFWGGGVRRGCIFYVYLPIVPTTDNSK